MFDSEAASKFIQSYVNQPPKYRKVVNFYIFTRDSDPDEYQKLASYGFPHDLNINNYYAIIHLLTDYGHELFLAIQSPKQKKFTIVPCERSLSSESCLELMKEKINYLETII